MTPTELVHNELSRFLLSSDAEVVCIKGSWGIGKTFTWQAQLSKAVKEQKLGKTRYSYVSLFGVVSQFEIERL